MAGSLGLLARLRLRHLRSGARFLLFAAGADIDEDCGFLERTYQLYLVAIFAVVLALSWAQVVDLVEGTRDAMGSLAGALGMLLLAVAPSIALVCWAVAALRETPLRLTSPDIAWLSRVVRPQELLAVQLVGSALVVATVSALLGYLLGVLTRAPAPLAWCPLVASLALAARLLALVLGLARSAVLPRRRRLVTVVAGVLAALLAGLLALALPTLVFLLGWLVTFGALLLDVVIAALALWLASRSDMTFIVDDNELYAARVSLSFLAFANAGAYKEACRRRRLGRRRQARRTWHFARGSAAYVSHALVSLARQPSMALSALLWGGALVPAGALLVATGANAGVLFCWFFGVALAQREPLPIAHVFRADCANRLVRQLLPSAPLALLLLDALPLLVLALAASAAVVVPMAHLLGVVAAPAVLLAWALLVALVLVAALDDPGHVRSVGSFQFTAFAGGVLSVFAVCLVGLLGAVPALACAVLVDVLLARSLR